MIAGVPLAVLGSTGSIGRQTLDVLRQNPGVFRVAALSAGKNIELLAEQVEEFRPELVCLSEPECCDAFLNSAVGKVFAATGRLVSGTAGLCEAVTLPEVALAVIGISGFAAFEPVLAALQHGKHLALANKECLVAGGVILQAALRASSSLVVPVDSEHNSLYQCLARRGREEPVKRVIITASGGPFLDTPLRDLDAVTPEMAVRHPRWNMGQKISVDSATLMNKGLEVIEASYLFNLPPERIEVLIHPESVVHGLVEYEDGTVLAALYEPDMRVPITYALKVIAEHLRVPGGTGKNPIPLQPVSLKSGHSLLSLGKRGMLRFLDPDSERFPALALAYRVLREGGGAPAVLNAANEIAVQEFLNGRIGFSEIVPLAVAALEGYRDSNVPHTINNISDVILIDSWGRKFASEHVARPAPGAGEAKVGHAQRSGRAVLQ